GVNFMKNPANPNNKAAVTIASLIFRSSGQCSRQIKPSTRAISQPDLEPDQYRQANPMYPSNPTRTPRDTFRSRSVNLHVTAIKMGRSKSIAPANAFG